MYVSFLPFYLSLSLFSLTTPHPSTHNPRPLTQQLTLDQITALYNFGQFQYSYGNYSGAADYLYHFRVLSTDVELTTSAHWGKLASDILTGSWDTALEELNTLRDLIDSRSGGGPAGAGAGVDKVVVGTEKEKVGTDKVEKTEKTEPALVQLHSRTWLVHWSLFIYFNHAQGRTLLLETFLSPTYLNTIQTSCPWVLRYVTASAILSRNTKSTTTTTNNTTTTTPVSPRVRNAIRDLVKVIQTEEYQYTDPLTSFLKHLYIHFDFSAAQEQLELASLVLRHDFFLGEFIGEFLDCARYLVSEVYCRIHERIGIRDLEEKLVFGEKSGEQEGEREGEKWVVNVMREMKMGADAKIDLEKVRCVSLSLLCYLLTDAPRI